MTTYRTGTMICAALLLLAAAPFLSAGEFRVQNFNLSTSILMDMYNQIKDTAQENVEMKQVFINPNVITMQIQNAGAPAVFRFKFKIYDYDWSTSLPVASAGVFQTIGAVPPGTAILNLDSMDQNVHIDGHFEKDYETFVKNKYEGQYQDSGPDQATISRAIADIQAKQFYLSVTDEHDTEISPRMRLLLFAPQSSAANPAVPLSPVNMTVGTTLPTFIWSPVSGANYYILTLAEDASLGNPVFQSAQLSMSSYSYGPGDRMLEKGKTYFWQVQSFKGAGSPIGGNDGRSAVARFALSADPSVSGSAADLERLLRQGSPDPAAFEGLEGYQLKTVKLDGVSPDPDAVKALNAALNSKKAVILSAQQDKTKK